MERLALCFRVKPEKLEEYLKAHREIWPEITKGLKDAGCKDMTIFQRENVMFLFAEIENIEEFNNIRAKDPYYHKWNEWMDQLYEAPFDKNEKSAFAVLNEIWRFEA